MFNTPGGIKARCGFNQCFSEASHVGKAMMGLAFLLLDFVRSFCQEYGAAWNWPKNWTRTAELVQKQQQQRRSWPAGEYASALDESFLRFFWPRPVHLFDTKHHCTLCKICTSYNCNAEEDLLSVQLVQWHWQSVVASAPNNPTHCPSLSPFSPFSPFPPFPPFSPFPPLPHFITSIVDPCVSFWCCTMLCLSTVGCGKLSQTSINLTFQYSSRPLVQFLTQFYFNPVVLCHIFNKQ